MSTFTCTAAQSNAPAIMSVNRTLTRVVEYACTLSASAGDVYQMVKIPNGAMVTRVAVACSCSAGAITVNIGDGNDTSAYGASVVLSGSVTLVTTMPYRGWGRSYSTEDTIDIVATVVSAADTLAKLKLIVDYTMQNGG